MSVVGVVAASAALAAVATATPALAQDAKTLRTRALAATCAHCHGTDGKAVGADGIRLAGQSKEQLVRLLTAFRAGEQAATLMPQIAKGFSAEQLDAIAGYFAAQR